MHISTVGKKSRRMPLNSESVIETVPAREGRPSVAYRFSGVEYVLVEFGEMSTSGPRNLGRESHSLNRNLGSRHPHTKRFALLAPILGGPKPECC